MGRLIPFVFLLLGLVVLVWVSYGGRSLSASNQGEISEKLVGRVYDAERRLLAASVPQKGLVLIPQAFEASADNLSILAKFTGRSKEELTLLLATSKNPVYLEMATPKRLPALKGLIYRSFFKREYPYGDLFAPVLGPAEPLSGLELYYQKLLTRKGSFLRTAFKVETQKRLKKDLHFTLKKLRAQAGSALVLELRSGRLIALVSEGQGGDFLAPVLDLSWVGAPFEEAYYDSMYPNITVFLRALGFGEPTGVDLPGEYPGIMPAEVNSLDEVHASLLQLVRAVGALATGKLVSPKIGLEVGVSPQESYSVAVEIKELEDLIPRAKGGVWWHGGSRKEGHFIMVGLWPRKRPTFAFGLYVEGVRAYGLPYYYTRFIPKAVKIEQASPRKVLAKEKKAPCVGHKMPDVRGLTLKAALERLAPLGLKVHFSGFGVTVKQWPAPGVSLKDVKICRLVLE